MSWVDFSQRSVVLAGVGVFPPVELPSELLPRAGLGDTASCCMSRYSPAADGLLAP